MCNKTHAKTEPKEILRIFEDLEVDRSTVKFSERREIKGILDRKLWKALQRVLILCLWLTFHPHIYILCVEKMGA
jgi:hypothetical protein